MLSDKDCTWLAFPIAISYKGIHVESHDWWAPIRFNLNVQGDKG